MAIQLWPKATEPEAKANLWRRLYDLRQLLPDLEQSLQVKSKTLQWRSHIFCCLDVFKVAFQSGAR